MTLRRVLIIERDPQSVEALSGKLTQAGFSVAVVAGTGCAEGIWSPIERLADHALPTLMKKVARHAISALAAGRYGGPTASAAKSGRSPSAASRTGANERR